MRHENRGPLIDYMISGAVIVQVLEGSNAVEQYRKIMGATNPEKAEEGSIRKEFSLNMNITITFYHEKIFRIIFYMYEFSFYWKYSIFTSNLFIILLLKLPSNPKVKDILCHQSESHLWGLTTGQR